MQVALGHDALADQLVEPRIAERVRALAPQLERPLVAVQHDTLVLKYFLHITKHEQKQRLLEREKDPASAWKLNPNDWKERDYWDEYTEAYEDAISKTAAEHAPWMVVPANAKWYRNLVIAESIVEALRAHRKHWRRKLKSMAAQAKAGLAAYRRQRKE